MREIKFRAWDEELKLMFREDHGPEIVVTLDGGIFQRAGAELYPDNPIKGLILEQFTGLLDKNGTEIYEGDVLSWYDWSAEDQARRCAVVETHCGAWGSRSLHPENEHPDDESWQPFVGEDDVADLAGGSPENEIGSQTTLVVIGNIHENPELLK